MMGAPVEQNEQTNPVDQVEFDLPLQQEGPSAIPQTDRLGPNWEHPEGVDFAEVEYEYAPRVKSAHVIAYACGVIAMAAASIWLVMHAPERRPFGEWTWTAPALPDFSGMSTPQVPEALKRLPDGLKRIPEQLARVPAETTRLFARATGRLAPDPPTVSPAAPATPAPPPPTAVAPAPVAPEPPPTVTTPEPRATGPEPRTQSAPSPPVAPNTPRTQPRASTATATASRRATVAAPVPRPAPSATVPAPPPPSSRASSVAPSPASSPTPRVAGGDGTTPPPVTSATSRDVVEPPVSRSAANAAAPAASAAAPVAVPTRPEASPPEAIRSPVSPEPRTESLRSPVIEADRAIRDVLGRYRTAFNVLDARAASDVWPTLDERTLNRAFDQLAEQNVSFDECAIDINGVLAEARCRGTIRFVPKIGSRTAQYEPRRWNFTLRKAYTGWVIHEVRAR